MSDHPQQPHIDEIAQANSTGEFDAVARRALVEFDGLNTRIIEQRQVKLDCGAGCSICCSLRVDVFAHEVFVVARHILDQFSDEAITALVERLCTHADTVLTLTPFEHATTNLRCPMLQDGCCSVYEARPHSCRRHQSQDVAVCQYTFDNPTDLESPAAHDRELFRALTLAMHEDIEAYAELGYDYTIYELGTALLEALEDPASWERWRNHEQAFLRASITPAA